MRRFRLLWSVPLLAIALGIAVLISAQVQSKKVVRDVQRGFEVHVESVARLVREGAREAATAIDLIYVMSEAHLKSTAHLLARVERQGAGAKGEMIREGVRVWVTETEDGEYEGEWGRVEEAQREPLVDEVLDHEEGELVEDGVAREMGLFCSYHTVLGKSRILCRGADHLSRLRRETGIAPMLLQVVGHDVVYVAIQDEEGVLMSSPNAGELSEWREDPFLRVSDGGQMRFRKIVRADTELFEGVGSFRLPDESMAIIRVGIDASSLVDVEREVTLRMRVLSMVVLILVGLSLGATWLIGRWEGKHRDAEARLLAHREENRHWQAIGQMAATVAHEVRNPLNTIGMVAQRLEYEFEVSEAERQEYGELLATLKTESERVNHVVTEFLELGKPLVLDRQAVALKELMEETLAPMKIRAEGKGETLRWEVSADGTVRVDRQRFGQVVVNLVGNALDAVGQDGEVDVRARVESGRFVLEVRDTGSGLDEERLVWIMQPFATTKGKGTGLGLPLAKRLVEAHGGTLRLTSVAGRGTTATVEIPNNGRSVG